MRSWTQRPGTRSDHRVLIVTASAMHLDPLADLVACEGPRVYVTLPPSIAAVSALATFDLVIAFGVRTSELTSLEELGLAGRMVVIEPPDRQALVQVIRGAMVARG